MYDICLVCWWEDDGQDDADADQVRGGPNKQYSLTAARQNYCTHGHMYKKGDGIDVVENPSESRRNLVHYVLGVDRGWEDFDEARFQGLLDKVAIED